MLTITAGARSAGDELDSSSTSSGRGKGRTRMKDTGAAVSESLSSSARSDLLTVLGELVWPNGEQAWTSSIVQVMQLLGFEERTARQAITRASKAGWLIPERHGRSTRWHLSPRLIRAFEEGTRRVAALSEPFDDWDRRWLTLIVTVPTELRAQRHKLYRRLNWAGLGTPWPGVWLTPHTDRGHDVAEVLDELGLRPHSIVTKGEITDWGLSLDAIVERGWNLAEVVDLYEEIDASVPQVLPTDPDDLIVAHIRLTSALQKLPTYDPQLPEVLAPEWIGRRVAGRLQNLMISSQAAVRRRWREIDDLSQA